MIKKLWGRIVINQYLKDAPEPELHNMIIKNKLEEKYYFKWQIVHPGLQHLKVVLSGSLDMSAKIPKMIPKMNSFQMTSGVYQTVIILVNLR